MRSSGIPRRCSYVVLNLARFEMLQGAALESHYLDLTGIRAAVFHRGMDWPFREVTNRWRDFPFNGHLNLSPRQATHSGFRYYTHGCCRFFSHNCGPQDCELANPLGLAQSEHPPLTQELSVYCKWVVARLNPTTTHTFHPRAFCKQE